MLKTNIMFIQCLTVTHPGSGTALGFVDLPVQRERHTQWPVIPGSSLKGVLRSTSSSNGGSPDDDTVVIAFGPKPRVPGAEEDEANEHAGAISIADARILAFPVRSMAGVFAWTTCPSALKLLRRNYENYGKNPMPDVPPTVEKNNAFCGQDSPLILKEAGNKIILEEFDFDVVPSGNESVSAIADWISNEGIADKDTADRFRLNLVILNDEDFTHFTRFATEVTARIRLEYETKTAVDGALFYEESLPPETIFQALVIASDSRKKEKPMEAEEILQQIKGRVGNRIQIGAGETVGKGICSVKFSDLDKKEKEQ